MSHRALIFTDLVDSTRLVEQVGDARAAEVWAEHDRRARQLLVQHGGREIDRSDGFFLLFDDIAPAAAYAVAYHQAMAGLDIRARIGLHMGAVTLRDNDPADVARGAKPVEVEGLAKPFAARIMGLAQGQQTLLSASARAALGEHLPAGAELRSHGHYRLKGVEEPVEIFELGAASSAFVPPDDAQKAYRVVRANGLWCPLREVRHNLVTERDAFVGRSSELRALSRRLDAGARLITVLGSGGTGKTRLVRRYGLAWLGDWPGGVYFCDLSEARSLDGIHFAVAFALGVPLGKGDPTVQLGHAMAGRGRCLVVLDNFEQVVAHAPSSLGHWLDRTAEAAFIVTSREQLHLGGEEIFRVEPLQLDTDAVALFTVRAQAQRPEFRLDSHNRDAVTEVVRLLDGLPLAIELAAARVRLLSPGQLVDRMKDRFLLLTGAKGTAARQATLKAAIDWSWDLLTPWEQAALAQCAVFEGGFTLDAAEAVLDLGLWPEAPVAMDAVQALVDKSLLRTWQATAAGRYDIDEPYFGMYLSIHEYAAGKLQGGDANAVQRAHQRHGHYFAGFGSDEAIDALSARGGLKKRRALALEIDNLVLACRRAVQRSDAPVAVASCRAAWQVLEHQGPMALGAALSSSVLSLHGMDDSLRVIALMTRATPAWRSGNMAEALTYLEHALALTKALGDRLREAAVLGYLGNVQVLQSRYDEAQPLYESALALFREFGKRGRERWALGVLANLHEAQGRVQLAQQHFDAALAIHRELGDRVSEGLELGNMGALLLNTGRFTDARVTFEQALQIHRECGNRREEALVLNNLGNLRGDLGAFDDALDLYGQALAIAREVGIRLYESVVLGNLGNVHAALRGLEPARQLYESALTINREIGNQRSEGLNLGNLGLVAHKQGRLDDAQAFFEQALAKHRAGGYRRFEGAALGTLADLLIDQGQLAQARVALRDGEALLREVQDEFELAKLLCVRGLAERAAGDAAAANTTLAQAERVAVEVNALPESELGRYVARLRVALA